MTANHDAQPVQRLCEAPMTVFHVPLYPVVSSVLHRLAPVLMRLCVQTYIACGLSSI